MYVILNALRRKNELRVAANTQESSAAAAAAPSGAQIMPAVANWAPEAEVPPPPQPQPALTSYLLLGNNLPSFSDIFYDIDNLFKVNRVSNALDKVNKLNLKSKIEKLSKLVVGGNVTIRDIFMAQAIKDNINTLANLDRQSEIMCFTEFKSAFRQTFTAPPTETFYEKKL